MSKSLKLGIALSVCVIASSALAQDMNPAVKARKAQMDLFLFHCGYVAAMAQGKIPYDAAAAQKAADSFVYLTKVDQSRYWVKGTDSDSIQGTRALPAIMDHPEDVAKHLQDLSEAALKLQAAASSGQEALGAPVKAVFEVCGSCHKAYRQPS